MSGKLITIGVRISPEIRDTLKTIAKHEKRTLSQFVRILIETELAKRERKQNKKPKK